MVIPPVWGVVVINDINQEELGAVSRVIDEVTNRFYQNFSTFKVDGASNRVQRDCCR